ncbi:FAD-dependent oxidoreductase [Glaciihabitans sp. UYNi722]|uniref:FAD-dependent oxidoreductase n=1 Tax=Glaciihabitans sp. UYNi722 TaxID=3156344 RepID=UPI003395CC02
MILDSAASSTKTGNSSRSGSDSTEFLVIGAGLAGAATAWQLAQGGRQVTIVERSTPANPWGSSHGSARIFRYAYENPLYTRLVVEARQGWDELEAAAGIELLTASGCLDFGSRHPLKLLQTSLRQASITHEMFDREQAAALWPSIASDGDVLWHPDAAVIDAEGAVRAMVAEAVAAGARVITDYAVGSVRRTDFGFQVSPEASDTSDSLRARNVINADRVIVAAGSWLPGLLAGLPLSKGFLNRMPRLEVRQEQVFHFPYRDQAEGARDSDGFGWPTFIHQTEEIHAYGLPGGRDADFRGQKIAEFNGGRVLSSAADRDDRIDAANRLRMIAYVKHHFPGLIPDPYAEATCVFTNTPTEDFVVDGEDGLLILSPCSGHGAKFAPVIGRIAADAITGRMAAPNLFRV